MPRLLQRVLLNAAGVLLALFILGPLVWMVDASFQSESELSARPIHLLPQVPSLENYGYVFTGAIPRNLLGSGVLTPNISQEAREILPALKNSTIVAAATAAIDLVVGTIAAYTFTRLRFRFRTTLFNLVLASRLLPAVAIAIPYYVLVNNLGLLNTYLGLILVYLTFSLPFTIWFLSTYFRYVPQEMEDAARTDGCTRLGALVRILIPVAAPGIAAAAAFAFMLSYSEFLFALFLTQTIQSQTMPVIIASVAVNPNASLSLISVSVSLAMVVPIAFALIFRRYLIRGMLSGALQ
jgi:multiple sugar transport system permease protein